MMNSSGAAITWLGHATVLIELDGVRLLTDPVLRDRIGPLVRIAGGVERPEPVDYVLLSHLHADHADIPSLIEVARTVPVLAPEGAGRWLSRRGLQQVHELSAGSKLTLGAIELTATPAAHDRRRRPLGAVADPLGYVMRGSRSVYFAGDTDLFPEMARLRGTVDVVLLPVWGWGARLGPGHLDPERAAAAAASIAPGVAIPIHWGTYALGWRARRAQRVDWPAREFVRIADRQAPDVEVRVLSPGERTEL
jgi:L-ascorbate metabolism protein UlaG (beta-lactamase superfamily)